MFQAADDADGLVAMERQHLMQLKKSMETEMGLIQQQLKVISDRMQILPGNRFCNQNNL